MFQAGKKRCRLIALPLGARNAYVNSTTQGCAEAANADGSGLAGTGMRLAPGWSRAGVVSSRELGAQSVRRSALGRTALVGTRPVHFAESESSAGSCGTRCCREHQHGGLVSGPIRRAATAGRHAPREDRTPAGAPARAAQRQAEGAPRALERRAAEPHGALAERVRSNGAAPEMRQLRIEQRLSLLAIFTPAQRTTWRSQHGGSRMGRTGMGMRLHAGGQRHGRHARRRHGEHARWHAQHARWQHARWHGLWGRDGDGRGRVPRLHGLYELRRRRGVRNATVAAGSRGTSCAPAQLRPELRTAARSASHEQDWNCRRGWPARSLPHARVPANAGTALRSGADRNAGFEQSRRFSACPGIAFCWRGRGRPRSSSPPARVPAALRAPVAGAGSALHRRPGHRAVDLRG